MKIPYLNTQPETDLLTTLLLTPLWWVLGINIFIYHAVVYWAFLKVLMTAIQKTKVIRIPQPVYWLAVFLVFYLGSLLLNLGNHPVQRIFASINNYSVWVMGFLILLILSNGDAKNLLARIFTVGRMLCLMTGGIAIILILMWAFSPYNLKDHPFSLLGHVLPWLRKYPFFYMLLTLRVTDSGWIAGGTLPRISIYSSVFIATGGFMVMVLPLMMAHYQKWSQKKFEFIVVFLVSIIPLFFSLSRAAVCSFIGAWVLVMVIEKGLRFYWAFLCFVAALLISGVFYGGLEWLLQLRTYSNIARLNIYQAALDNVIENNLWMGLGVRLRDEFTMMAIGSHSTYMGILLVTGVLGLSAFLGFQVSVFIGWYRQRSFLHTPEHWLIWKYLGISFIGATGTLVTSSLDALPFIAYTYFMIIACIFALSQLLRENQNTGQPFLATSGEPHEG